MTTKTDDQFVRMFQEKAAAAGAYVGKIDGSAGRGTLAALDLMSFNIPTPTPRPDVLENIPEDGEAKLKGVHPDLVKVVYSASLTSKTPFTVIEGLRTLERQRYLLSIKATTTLKSRHLTGHAVDLWPLDAAGKRLPSDAAFPRGSQAAKDADAALWAGLREIASAVKSAGKEFGIAVEWGGDWKSFKDGPHFQLSTSRYPA